MCADRGGYKPDAYGVLWVAGCFGGAVLAHGLYDFFLSSSMDMGILSTLILIYAMIVFRNMMQNALDQSEHFETSGYKIRLGLYLYYGVLGILLMQFSILAIRYGGGLALWNLGKNVFGFYFVCTLLIVGLGNLTLEKGRWVPLFPRKS